MADKLPQTIAAVPTFTAGESPSPEKLNVLGAQLKRAMDQLERVAGDTHDESYPYFTSSTARLSQEWGKRITSDVAVTGASTLSLDIVNLARMIGPSANLNPTMPDGTVPVTEAVPAGVYEFRTRYPLVGVTSSTDTAVQSASTVLTMNGTGEYHLDGRGNIFTYDATSGGTITYTTTPSAWAYGASHAGASPNVIPHPYQIDNTATSPRGCIVSATRDALGRHTVQLPLYTHHIRNAEQTSSVLSVADPINGQQYVLPEVLDGMTAGDTIPSQFIYLKNYTTGEVYDDATYYYSTTDTYLVGGVDLTTEVARGDDFLTVTVGTNITTVLDDLRNKMGYHDHSGTFGDSPVSAEDIIGWTEVAGNSGRFTISDIPGNYAPQYLHRDGFKLSESDPNDNNIMRGDLVIGSSSGAPGSYYSLTGNSFALYFGTNGGPVIYKDTINDLQILNTNRDIDITANDDIHLVAGEDVNIEGGLVMESGYINNSLHSTYGISNTGLLLSGSAGHFNGRRAAVAAEGIAAGPYAGGAVSTGNELDLWEIQVDGTGGGTAAYDYATVHLGTPSQYPTQLGWKVPRIHFLHYAQQNVIFTGRDISGAASFTPADIVFWQESFPWPDYINNDVVNASGGSMILSVQVAVKPSTTTDEWFMNGSMGQRSGGGYDRHQTVGVTWKNNNLYINIGANNAEYPTVTEFDASDNSIYEMPVDVKIFAVVASNAHSSQGLTFS